MIEETQMIQTLLDSGAFEIQKRAGEEGIYDVPYMLNDALECYLVFSGASIKGEFREDLEDEPVSGNLVEEGSRKGIIIRQGEQNTCTLWYMEVHKELALYRHHEIGHFWEEGAWQWRRLVYIIGTMQDKYLFMGEEVCNQEELELIPLMEFSPFHRYFPALRYAPEEYVTTEEGCRLAIRLAKEAKDKEYQFLCWLYLHFPNGFLENCLHKKLMSKKRAKLYDLVTEKCQKAGMQYPERDYGEEKNELRGRMRQELHEKFLQNGFEGIYPNYRRKGVRIQVAEEHPFTRMESFEDGFRLQLMVSELEREEDGFNRGFFTGKGRRGYICSPEEYFLPSEH